MCVCARVCVCMCVACELKKNVHKVWGTEMLIYMYVCVCVFIYMYMKSDK